MIEFKRLITNYLRIINNYLQQSLECKNIPLGLKKAIYYSLNAGGKRLRPIIFYETFKMFDQNIEKVLPFGCGLEMIHTYSLIHDDLPIMDDDDYRRGKLTNHLVFGEANALLAGDALFSLGLEEMNRIHPDVDCELLAEALGVVLRGIGPEGMVGGQYLDLFFEGKNIDLKNLQDIHQRKTGALILAAVESATILGQADLKVKQVLKQFGELLGLLFQVVDDLLDVVGAEEKLGKAVNRDAALQKATYPGLLGLSAARKMAIETKEKALTTLEPLGNQALFFIKLTEFIFSRDT